jgi:glycosyltransferase involved in cell wall biosynthesis
MRVFYDHQVTSLQDAGGVSRYYFELVRALLQTGEMSAELLLGTNRSVLPFDSLRPNARVVSWPSFFPAGYARYAVNEALTAGLVCLGVGAQGKVDVYHAGYQRVLPYIAGKAVVVTHHDSTPQRFPELFRDASSIRERLEKVYTRADRIICISESCRADLLQYFAVEAERCSVIHHGFTPLIEDPDITPGTLFPDQPYLLFVGARHAYKNFPAVLKALALQKDTDLRLLVVGGGPFTATETDTLAQLRLTERVRLLPRASDTVLAAAYRHAHMFIYPSLYEGFGFPPLEAMHAGCPALVSRSSAMPEICGDAAFYFDPLKVEELAELIARLQASETLRLSKRELGMAQVRKYTWGRSAAQTLHVYRQAIGFSG